MEHSEQIDKISPALVKMQGELKQANFNKTNPHFKSKFADYLSCREACKEPLLTNELCALQDVVMKDGHMQMETMLVHSSGQWIKTYVPMFPKSEDSQAVGSAITYMKRYGLSAALGIVTGDEVDDDAEAAEGFPQNKPRDIQPAKKVVEDFAVTREIRQQINNFRADMKTPERNLFDGRIKKFCGSLEEASEKQLREILDDLKAKGVVAHAA